MPILRDEQKLASLEAHLAALTKFRKEFKALCDHPAIAPFVEKMNDKSTFYNFYARLSATCIQNSYRATTINHWVLGNHFSPKTIVGLYVLQKGRCLYCHKQMDSRFTVDHLLPISLGGSNRIPNITLCCKRCNSSKQDKFLPNNSR